MIRRLALSWLVGCAACWLAAAPASAETRVALVIGNSDYAHATTLANPGRDADAIAAALRADGFVVDEHKNAGFQELRGAILDFSQKAQAADVAVVYYAGHGVQVDGVNYLIPIDAALASSASLGLEAMPADMVLGAVARAHRLRLLILDACRENPFKAQLAALGSRAISRGLAPITAPGLGDTLIAYSAKDGTVAADGTGANSPFAAALARRLTEKGTEIDKMFREVRDDVLASTGNTQEPFVYGSRSSSDFYFMPGAPQQPLAPATPAADPQAIELAMWNSVANGNDAAQLQVYLQKYPNGVYAALARAKIAALSKPAQVASLPPAFAQPQRRFLTEADFQNILGLTRTSKITDAVRIFGRYDAEFPAGSFTWTDGATIKFTPGQELDVPCALVLSRFGNSLLAELCRADKDTRASLFGGFTNHGYGPGWRRGDLYVYISPGTLAEWGPKPSGVTDWGPRVDVQWTGG